MGLYDECCLEDIDTSDYSGDLNEDIDAEEREMDQEEKLVVGDVER